MSPKPLAFQQWPATHWPIPYGPPEGWPVVVDRVLDGDTFNGWACIGPRADFKYHYVSIRIAGIAKPETWELDGSYWTELLQTVLPRDTPVLCYVTAASFGRWVARVTLLDGRDLGSVLSPVTDDE